MNAISKKQFKQLIKAFDFTNLFNLLGWNYITGQDMVKVGLETFTLQSVAEKEDSGYWYAVRIAGDEYRTTALA